MTRIIPVLVGVCLCTHTVQAQPSTSPRNDTIQSNLLLKEVTITESKKRYLTSVAGSNYVFSKTDFERQQPLGTEEILRTAPGLLVQGDMGISNRLNVGIRGSNPRRSVRVLVMEDNVAMACAPYLDPQVYYNTPPERLQGIEILKGPEMLMHGGQSIYGAINYITRTPNYAPRTEVNITGGQHNFFSGMLNYGGKWNKVAADFGVLYKRFDGFIDNNSMRSVNASGKVFIDVGPRSNVYFKFNHHDEYYTTTYFGLTPFTFKHAPRSNPFDADAFSVKRTALDAGYEWRLGRLTFNTTGYYSNFDYDWWRQNFVVIRAADARRILGDAIVNSRFSYLNEVSTFGEDDWIRAGQTRGSLFRENTGNRLRNFKNSGLRQTMQWKTKGQHWSNQLDVSVGLHHERFRNGFLTADSSRFARSGRLTTDQLNLLQAWQFAAKNKWQYNRFSATALLRMESISMTNQNLLALSTNAGLAGTEDLRLENNYNVWLPGFTLEYDVISKPASQLTAHASYWQGFLPPTAGFGFLTVDANGNVTTTNITPASDINILPETSNSFDAGLRGSWARGAVSGELAFFRNDINNFYSAARNEAFQTLGKVRMQGLELSLRTDVDKWAG
nr:TonB-dependent receptor plug domain-containing protein [Chitinophagaceae bacterium]